ncbi:myb-like protein Q [Musca vetustissima]|uniref:myb-like protein Q n=1 Tax=Musca vetustissima TaxID=27455 RepID=UPI002AB7A567|nr:myb-like protein Q [Musca vetustissima]
MEWTREKTLALIQEYRKRRGLWDMTHEDYRKKDVKHKLLGEVVVSLGGNIPIMEIEKKFHTLRTQYHREINRMKRKEPYNSKWFGFKCLQFLSSPKACRSNKGRLKAEITEDGTVTTKYIIREAIPVVHQQHDTSAGSGNDNEEFLTLQRRPTTITYEAVPSGNATSTSSSRSHELEKLIEETTKDVEEIEEAKPKMTIKGIGVPLEAQQQHQHNTDTYTHAGASELQITNVETEHAELHHIEEDHDQLETLNIQSTSDEEMNYSTSSGNGHMNGGGTVATTNASSNTTTVHTIPARIIKIQRRDTHDQGEYYEQHHVPQQQQQQPPPSQQHHHHSQQQQQHHSQQHHHLHQTPATTHQLHTTVSPGGSTTTTKRIYYDAAGHHTATILTATPNPTSSSQQHQQHHQSSSGMTILNASTSTLSSPTSSTKLHLRNASLAPGTIHTMATTSPPLSLTANGTLVTTTAAAAPTTSSAMVRDEYTTYGEYVANEMRNITSREILISLKHKINTALFEANMQELQK